MSAVELKQQSPDLINGILAVGKKIENQQLSETSFLNIFLFIIDTAEARLYTFPQGLTVKSPLTGRAQEFLLAPDQRYEAQRKFGDGISIVIY